MGDEPEVLDRKRGEGGCEKLGQCTEPWRSRSESLAWMSAFSIE